MITQVVSLGLTFLLAWQGRDGKTWTPTFKGKPHERFIAAVRHYDERMGLEPATVLVTQRGVVINGKERCAWAWRDTAWSDDVIGYWATPQCAAHKPEVLALHEQCHRRMAHLEPAFWGLDNATKERETRDCVIAYSAKERQ